MFLLHYYCYFKLLLIRPRLLDQFALLIIFIIINMSRYFGCYLMQVT